jgi:hypothetical protein
VYLRSAFARHPYYRRVPAVLSVHNAGYQGHFPPSTLPEIGIPWDLFNWEFLEWYDKVNWLKGGIVSADAVVTVSATHARELQSPEGGFGLGDTFRALRDRLFGITNGIDTGIWDPAHDPHIAARFTAQNLEGKRQCKAALQARFGLAPNPRTPVFGMAARLVAQKGLDLLVDGRALGATDAQYVFLGQGTALRRGAETARGACSRIVLPSRPFSDPRSSMWSSPAPTCCSCRVGTDLRPHADARPALRHAPCRASHRAVSTTPSTTESPGSCSTSSPSPRSRPRCSVPSATMTMSVDGTHACAGDNQELQLAALGVEIPRRLPQALEVAERTGRGTDC